jgi:hypothetical protein
MITQGTFNDLGLVSCFLPQSDLAVFCLWPQGCLPYRPQLTEETHQGS